MALEKCKTTTRKTTNVKNQTGGKVGEKIAFNQKGKFRRAAVKGLRIIGDCVWKMHVRKTIRRVEAILGFTFALNKQKQTI